PVHETHGTVAVETGGGPLNSQRRQHATMPVGNRHRDPDDAHREFLVVNGIALLAYPGELGFKVGNTRYGVLGVALEIDAPEQACSHPLIEMGEHHLAPGSAMSWHAAAGLEVH